ncbi:phage tail assembly chaperone [Oceanicola sp. 22II-s10i]|nr:phage tail assembly chaperone [Oceanicola sp. 22II-s10i]
MTPEETSTLIAGWNAAQQEASGQVPPMSRERFDELKRRYPDD